MSKQKKKKIDTKNFTIKLLLILIHLIIITILLVYDYKLYLDEKTILPWDNIKDINSYTYIKVSKMSEKFAYYTNTNIGIHFVIEEENTGKWHTYLIAIDENEYNKYKPIIDYTYERTTKTPKPIKVYGYPTITENELKTLAIKNISHFLPKENEVIINEKNYLKYLTNYYLDTTKEKKSLFNTKLIAATSILILMTISLIMTIFNIELYKNRK